MKKICTVVMVLIFVLSLCVFPQADAGNNDVTILFTSDLHSHLLPAANENGEGEYGGYARLMTRIKEQKAISPDAILVDGGDFSMGSLFQTAYTSSAIELRMMGAMGYDATTFGNHEYDYLQSGLKSMLNAAKNSAESVPGIVCANYMPPKKGQDGYDEEMWAALNNYGVKDYMILERGGVYYVIFGIFGVDSDDCAPNSGMIFEDPAATAQKTVDTAVKECKDTFDADPIVVCLSHSGAETDGTGEDVDLAKAVQGIDVIISGHTHTTLTKPITVNDTVIVSAGDYGRYLGVVKLNKDGTLKNYALFDVDETVDEDQTIAVMVESYKATVENDYLSKYGYSFDQVLVNNKYKFDTVDEVYDTQHESTLGNLFADAYKVAAEKVTGKKVDVALTAAGVIRATMPIGNITVSDVFNAASLGVGTEGELVSIYVTGKDLKNAIELDASVQPLMTSAQLFMSGVRYSFNKNRMIFNKVDFAELENKDGTFSKIDDEKLYHIVAGMYIGQMLGSAEETSMGILTITPRDIDGNPIAVNELVNYVIKDENKTPLKEWYAIASYLDSMEKEMDKAYSKPDGRKVVYSSFNPVKLLKNANIFTYAVLAVAVTIAIVFAILAWKVVRKIKRKKLAKAC